MDQSELRKIENRCIQEQFPGCVTACPLHVNVRTFIRHMSEEKWDQAWKVLHKTLPLPGILGRICDAPCQSRCKRNEAGGAIEIGALERFCVSQPPPRRFFPPMPFRNQAVAVVGTGLSGLTAAWDLLRKGYGVHLFQAEPPVTYLLNRYPDFLTHDIITGELAILEELGAFHHSGVEINSRAFIEKCRRDFEALFLCLDGMDAASWGLDLKGKGSPPHPLQTTNLEGVFAGGLSRSPVQQAAEGRWGATSMDRHLQKVSLTAGREKDGPYETGLYTSLSGIAPQPPTPFSGRHGFYSAEEARTEAARCIQCECLECVKVCAYLEAFKGYPKKYTREIYNNESIVMGNHKANKLINSCSLCGLCERVCPEDFPMQELCLEARRSMVRREKMPPSAHEFALMDMAFSQSERCSLAKCEPGADKCDYLFFPGCQLAATRPDQTIRVYEHLRSGLSNGVGLMLGCCGAPAHWAGEETLFEEQLDIFRKNWEKLGRPKVVAACSTCLLMLRQHLQVIGATSLWGIFPEKGLPPPVFRPEGSPVIHDPCTTRGDERTQDAVREILERSDIPWKELELSRDKTECCGFGGLMQNANPTLAREVVARRGALDDADYLTYCAMCRDSLAAVGKRTIHLLDLFFPQGESDPAKSPRVRWSERQENRIRLKERLQRDLWKEEYLQMEPHEGILLKMEAEVRDRLDRRRILDDDIKRVIHHAQTTAQRLYHPETGHYKASFKPYKTTFWIEYTPRREGYEIHNAYAHRMEVVKGGHL